MTQPSRGRVEGIGYDPSMTTLTYQGHSCLTLNLPGGESLLVDPFFSENPVATQTAAEQNPTAILLTHGHFDHVGHVSTNESECQTDLVEIARQTGCQVVCNFEIGVWLQSRGVENVHQMQPGGGFTFPWGRCKMTPAIHGSMLPDGSDGGVAGGYLLTLDDCVVYLAGDTALFSDMQLIGDLQDGRQIDLAVLPIGDNFTMGPHDAYIAAGYLDARQVLPVHYDTWPPIAQDAADWADWVSRETDSEGVVAAPGDTIAVPESAVIDN